MTGWIADRYPGIRYSHDPTSGPSALNHDKLRGPRANFFPVRAQQNTRIHEAMITSQITNSASLRSFLTGLRARPLHTNRYITFPMLYLQFVACDVTRNGHGLTNLRLPRHAGHGRSGRLNQRDARFEITDHCTPGTT